MNAVRCWHSIISFGFVLFSITSQAQVVESSPAIRVESRRVLVPVSWCGKVSCDRYGCSWDGDIIRLAQSVALGRADQLSPFKLGCLSASRLRLFEYGQERKIESVEALR